MAVGRFDVTRKASLSFSVTLFFGALLCWACVLCLRPKLLLGAFWGVLTYAPLVSANYKVIRIDHKFVLGCMQVSERVTAGSCESML